MPQSIDPSSLRVSRLSRARETALMSIEVRSRTNRGLEFSSTALALSATASLAWHPNATAVWMWAAWLASAIGLSFWAWRVRAWGVLCMNLTYMALDVVGLVRFLGAS
jgi:hypothetical protein